MGQTDRSGVVLDRPASMGRMVLDRVEASADREAFRSRVGTEWHSMTWREVGVRVRELAAGLLALGLQREEPVAIISGTRLEWALVDFGVMCAGGATTTIYPSTMPSDVTYILADAGCRIAIVEDLEQLTKVRDGRGDLPQLEYVVVIEAQDATDEDFVLSLDQLAERGRAHLADAPAAVDEAVAAVGSEHLATLIYTSGTTGRPKGVRLVHDCWTYEAVAVDMLGFVTTDDLQYLWLPLSHAFGKEMLSLQLQLGFATAIDGDVTRIVENVAVIQPTFMCAAPRIFEKAHARVTALAAAEGGAKKKIFDWAVGVGSQVIEAEQAGKPVGRVLAAQYTVADRLVFAKLRHRFGGRLRFFVSGSAALSPQIGRFFAAARMPVVEGYGLTETSASATVNLLQRNRIGTVGPALPGTELRIAADGEVLVRGPGVMRGYHNLPELTAEALSEDGWLRTGDIGELDSDGYLRITDRKKDMLKTSNGKYVAPQAIETGLKALCGLVSHVLVHGDGRSYVTALIALDPDALTQWGATHGREGAPYDELVALPDVRTEVAAAVKELNAGLPRWETVKAFELLPQDLTIESGELTPSLKVKRRVVETRYRDVLDRLYAEQRVEA